MYKYVLIAISVTACGDFEVGGQHVEEVVDSGADADVQVELGTDVQALTALDGYGINRDTGGYCHPATNVVCRYPKDKVARYRFLASTCDSWWQSRFVEAFNDFLVVERDLGWDIQDPTSSGQADIYMECASVSDTLLGVFQRDLSAVIGNPAAGPGAYQTWNTGRIKIDSPEMNANSVWAGKTDVQRQRFARNVILHEMFHSVGLGHHSDNVSGTVLMGGSGLTTGSGFWTGLRYPSSKEFGWIKNYVP